MKKIALLACASALFACSSSNNGTTGATTGAVAGTTAAATSSGAVTTTSGTTGTGVGTATTGTGTTGTASGTATTSGSTTGGGVCSPDAGVGEFGPCALNSDCSCPLGCGTDPVQGSGVCLFACTTTADCPDTLTACVGGTCVSNLCAADGGTLYNPCNAVGTNDGICVSAFDVNFNLVGECQQGGSAAAAAMCTQQAPRDAGAGALCGAGDDCEGQLDGGAATICQAVCDPTSATNQCGSGLACTPNPAGNGVQDGLCVTTGVGGCANGVDPSGTLGVSCANGAACGCPQNCVEDPVQEQNVCAIPCTSTATDCSDPSTSCQNGFCVGNFCAPDAGPFYTVCNAQTDGGDGYCQPILNNNQTTQDQVGVCYQTGTADSGFACDPAAVRFDAGALCVTGTVCYALDAGTSYCEPGCDPTKASTCGSGNVCAFNYNGQAPNAGICYAGGPGGCAEGLTAAGSSTELGTCATSAFCGCPQTCVADTGSGNNFCELPCTSAADCDVPTTACLGGTCAPNYCDSNPLGATVPGAYDAPCTVSDAGDGTCQAQYPAFSFFGEFISEGLPPYGLCQLDGTDTVASQGQCDETLSSASASLCQGGSQCFTIDQNGDTACIALCNPTTFDGGSCGTGNGCFGFFSDFEGFSGIAPTYGICQQCTPPTSDAGFGCLTNSECCSQQCTMTSDGGICQ